MRSEPLSPAIRVTLAVVAAYVGIFLLQVRCAPARKESPLVTPQVAPLEREDALTDNGDAGPVPLLSPVLPERPHPWQKRPPCDQDAVEEEIQGACYGRMDRSPPCGPKLVEHRGKCYRTIARNVPPVSGPGE